ncbi:MAG: pirin family protein [Cyanobacteria bacterium TGS_CYA1]|nr:pirin family protein [Cyanobacteria bacterium TGS_CYA1]
MNNKKIKSINRAGSSHWVGDGFPVRNFFPSSGVDKDINPFLMLDYAGPAQFKPSARPKGVGEHPHRGFETVTIAYQGSVEHKDSAGNQGIIHPGDVQWMTAGSGVVHEEMHEREFSKNGGEFEMIQLWVNLPAVHKMTSPRYQTLLSRDIACVKLDQQGSIARVIAGTLQDATGPANTFTPVSLIDLKLTGDSNVILPVTRGFSSALLFMEGEVEIDGATIADEPRLVLMDTAGDTIEIKSSRQSRLLFMAGEPINEPVASYGPFVMNTKAEIFQAISDFQSGKMGRVHTP